MPPRIYSDSLIISIFLCQTLRGLSSKEILEETSCILGKVPALSTYHYRVSKLDEQKLKVLIQELAKRLNPGKACFCCFITDGTGFNYHEIYPLKFFRGSEMRKVRAHVKVLPIIGASPSGKRIYYC